MTAVNRLACDNNGQGVRLSQSRRPCDSISGSCPIPAAEVVIQPATYHGKVFVFLQHKRFVTCNEMSVVGTEIIEEAFHSEAQMRSDLVVYSAADHEARVVVGRSSAVVDWQLISACSRGA